MGYLLEGNQCNDAGLKASMASVQIDTFPLGKRNRFEAKATHLLPYEPVTKKRTPINRGYSEISDTSKVEVSRFGTKAGIRKT